MDRGASETLLAQFEEHLVLTNLSPLTVVNYLADLRSLLRWGVDCVTPDFSLDTLTPDIIRSYRSHLLKEKQCQGQGIEIEDKNICSCVEKGVPAIHADLDDGLHDFPDASFDYVVLSRTLQVVKRPDFILKEMLRVGKSCIVSPSAA